MNFWPPHHQTFHAARASRTRLIIMAPPASAQAPIHGSLLVSYDRLRIGSTIYSRQTMFMCLTLNNIHVRTTQVPRPFLLIKDFPGRLSLSLSRERGPCMWAGVAGRPSSRAPIPIAAVRYYAVPLVYLQLQQSTTSIMTVPTTLKLLDDQQCHHLLLRQPVAV